MLVGECLGDERLDRADEREKPRGSQASVRDTSWPRTRKPWRKMSICKSSIGQRLWTPRDETLGDRSVSRVVRPRPRETEL